MKRTLSLALSVVALALPGMNVAQAQPTNCRGNSNMCDALRNLEQARAALLRADNNKGGYKKRALVAVDRAIQDVRAGIEYSQQR